MKKRWISWLLTLCMLVSAFPVNIYADTATGTDEDTGSSEEVPEDESSEVPEDESSGVPEDDSSKVPEDDSSKVPEDESSEIPEDDSSKVPEDDSSKVPEDDSSDSIAEHEYTAVVTEPTCTEQGYTTYTCSHCEDSYVDDYVEALGHDYVRGTCSRCGDVISIAPEVSYTNEAASGKVHLTWTAVEDAALYYVYRVPDHADGYEDVTVTEALEYVDETAVPGVLYCYYVVPAWEDGTIEQSAAGTVYAVCDLAQPVIQTANDAATGNITVSWKTIEGAVAYEVYGSDAEDGDFVLLATVTETKWVDTTKMAEERGYYKVAALAENPEANSVLSKVKTRLADLPRPTVTVSNDAATGKVKLTWPEVEGAVKYSVYGSTSKDGSYTLLKTVTGTSHIHKNGKAGTMYYYKVRAVASDTNANSAYSAVRSRTCDLARPVIERGATTVSSIKITWNKVTNSNGYIVYRSTSKNGTYTKIGTTTAVSYTDKKVSAGKTYYYKVVARSSNSAANSVKSLSITAKAVPAAPVMKTTANATKTSIKVSWNQVSGASGYYVYRRTSTSDSWKRIKTITSGSTLSYQDTEASGNYYYCVAAYKTVNGTKYTGYKSEAIRVRTLGKPSITVELDDYDFRNRISWKSITGATGYQVYYKTENGSWKRAATVGKVTSYTHSVNHGVCYSYKVRPIYKNNGVTTYGPYSKVSEEFLHYYTPEYATAMSDQSKSSTTTTIVLVQNNGVGKMRFYAEGGMWFDTMESGYYDREIVLYDYEAYEKGKKKKVNYVDIAPGETGVLVIGVNSATRYNDETTIALNMYYDGVYYATYTNSYGSAYYMYE